MFLPAIVGPEIAASDDVDGCAVAAGLVAFLDPFSGVTLDEALGVDLRKDLLDSLGDKVVFYDSPSEGPLSLGQTVMLKVKDAKKLQDSLDQAVKGLGKALGADLTEIDGIAI